MATTLAQFYQEEADRFGEWLARVGGERDAARDERENAQAAVDAAAAALEAKSKEIAAKMARLPSTTVPAETEALVRDIAAQVIVQRQLATATRDQRRRLAAADARTAALTEATRRLEPRIAELGTAVTRATADAVIRDAWKTAVIVSPFSDIAAQATAAKGAPLTAAQTKINDIPDKLRDLAVARRGAAVAAITAASGELAAVEAARLAELAAAPAGTADQVAAARLTFQAAAAALGDFATTAAARLGRARGVLDQLVAPGAVAISAEEKSAATAGTVQTDAEAALSKETDYLGAVGDEIATASALAAATRALLGGDPTLDPAHDASLDDERQHEHDAAQAITDTSGDWTGAPRDAIDRWAGILSDGTWRTLSAFLEAKATLDDLEGLGANRHTQLLGALGTAETALIGKLEAAGRAERRRLYLDLEAARARATAESLAGSRDADLFLSLRSNS